MKAFQVQHLNNVGVLESCGYFVCREDAELKKQILIEASYDICTEIEYFIEEHEITHILDGAYHTYIPAIGEKEEDVL